MRPATILTFLQDPRTLLAVERADAAAWTAGIDEIVIPGIERASLPRLRDAQLAAIRGIADKRCSLVLGPPGTGKTATLAWAIVGAALASARRRRPFRVLITAFTKDASANLLNAVVKAARQIGESVSAYYVGNAPDTDLDTDVGVLQRKELANALAHQQCVVGMTTWSVHATLEGGHHGGERCMDAEVFDLACIDEASQLLLSHGLMSLAPLRETGRIVVAGDDRQLPPIGVEADWGEEASTLGGSLYGFLKNHGVEEYRLTETFRLNAPLVEAPAVFYEEYVSAVADRRLRLREGWDLGLPGWLKAALEPDYPVCILLHDGPPAATRSPMEAELVKQLVEVLATRLLDKDGRPYAGELWSEGLAVVTPHRAHNALIRKRLEEGTAGVGCVVETVDRIQGRERDAIVVSYAVADPEFAQTEAAFLYSPQRFNVAITRPRSKLVLVVSRRLLQVLPSDEGLVDAVALLREYVYGSESKGDFVHEFRGEPVRVDVRLRGFDDAKPLPEIERHPVPFEPEPILTPELEELNRVIRELAAANAQYGTARSFDVDKKLLRGRNDPVPFAWYRTLMMLGRIRIYSAEARTRYWVLAPLDGGARPLALRGPGVVTNIRAVVDELRQGYPSAYYVGKAKHAGVRDRFAWCDSEGIDVLAPILRRLEGEGLFALEQEAGAIVRVGPPRAETSEPRLLPPPVELTDEHFGLLNLLEDLELSRINLGIVESWVLPVELRDACRESRVPHVPFTRLTSVRKALGTLEAHGHVMIRGDHVRSRMAELARELRLVKQRFRPGDEDDRPYLVRAIKVLARKRTKPRRDIDLAPLIERMVNRRRHDADVVEVLRALPEVLRQGLNVATVDSVRLSGFQARGIEALIDAWLGDAGPQAFVLTAETGAGKTEAGVLPLLAGAAIDRLRGIRGTRAVLVYPRIRLAVNQAARLVGYAKALGDVTKQRIRITVGLQSRDVPKSWAPGDMGYHADTWLADDDGRGWTFPFFGCPTCKGQLRLEQGRRLEEPDSLCCDQPQCGWSFDGWVGTKEGLQKAPPSIFIPVTESLHQWLHKPEASQIFGDHYLMEGRPTAGACSPPRALLADEIHLYAHVHGAQLGWTLQRFLARSRLNGETRPLAIGMSATLGEAPAVWADLCGAAASDVRHIHPAPGEQSDNPRGREYYYFVQPEVESRGKDVAGASTTIQSLMLLAHGMRRRTGDEGGFRGVAFFDSLDKLKRLHGDYRDAEQNKALAALRTRNYGPDPQDPAHLRTMCCREPEGCARFRAGECWYFAATDDRQVRASREREGAIRQQPGTPLGVAPHPVSSQMSGKVDKMIDQSDLVFATSSLEVGYDDPDIMLVYQHYAPANVASFVQRKGRGGRGQDDRPVTGITLSIHSPRDAWFFRHPDRMLEAADFRVPVNLKNTFVRLGQVLVTLLDAAARYRARNVWTLSPDLPDELLTEADAFVRSTFGPDIYRDLEVTSLAELWAKERRDAPGLGAARSLADWRGRLERAPKRLFDSINLPRLDIATGLSASSEPTQEDVALGLAECAPGRVTFRWGRQEAHWLPPRGARAPWFTVDEGEYREFSIREGASTADLVALVPQEVRETLNNSFAAKVVRPVLLKPRVAGKGGSTAWRPEWAWDGQQRTAVPIAQGGVPVNHRSHAVLQGFVIAEEERPPARHPYSELDEFTDGTLQVFLGSSAQRKTGLRVTVAYWCSDIEIVEDTATRDREYHRQVFVSPADRRTPQFVGYGLVPEGIRLSLDSGRVDAFLASELHALQHDEARKRWHYGQYLRYLVMAHTGRVGLNRFEARQLADLCITAAAVDTVRGQLEHMLERRNPDRFADLLDTARQTHLLAHPQLSARRMDRLRERLREPNLLPALRAAFAQVRDATGFRGYLRSALIHGLLIRLRHLYVLHGLTDDNRVLAHARLPLQFGANADDRVTVCERGSGGDGTTRAFLERASSVFRDWRDERFLACPNAEADRAVERAYVQAQRDVSLRALNPRDAACVRILAQQLRLDASAGAALQAVLRLLYAGEEVQGRRFDTYDLFGEVRATRLTLASQLRRAPTEWELVGTVVRKCVDGGPDMPRWRELLAAYRELAASGAVTEGSLAPESRLAEQVYRVSARLCIDGCPACLHLGSDLMDDQLAEATTSRVLLERFGIFTFGE
jgi:hypothetical protein